MKNILLIMPYGSVGGMERLALTFYDYYKSIGYTVKAVKIIKLPTDIINFGEDELFMSRLDFAQMTKYNRALFYLKAPILLRKIIKANKITHSIAFGDMANMFSSLTFTNEFKIASIHALKSVEFSNKTYLNKLFKLGFKSSYFYFDKVVCISKAIKKDLIENCEFKFKNKLEVIYNPHNINLILDKSTEEIDDHELIYFRNKTILFLGRLSLQKAPWHLIKAFSLLATKNKDISLLFVGDGDPLVENYCKELIHNYALDERVVFLGRKANPYKYLTKATVLALSSHYEGTPNVIVESIALGVPMVVSNCTDGIIELMSNKDFSGGDELIYTESGIITPNFFEGSLGLPSTYDITKKEVVFSNSLLEVLTNENYKIILNQNKSDLLSKFDLKKVSENYLQEID
ncbi:MAG TPA: glycosyltransferase [Flavobacterium sp.]|uniref:glycosyltransferase n=1 Tax=unclassified Flavobacterium TaxID=196869 RepID=UPI0025B95F52|nr:MULTISPECIES: glycosyltransferase [unclassified Flavobacterium]HRE77337.1 glycosyltransferase [Flavobacterium sp.]